MTFGRSHTESPEVEVLTQELLNEIEAGQGEPLTIAAKRIPSYRQGQPVTLSCLLRWVLSGVVGPEGERVYLEAARLSGRWITSSAAIRRFVARQTPGSIKQPTRSRAASARAERAGRQLEELGVK